MQFPTNILYLKRSKIRNSMKAKEITVTKKDLEDLLNTAISEEISRLEQVNEKLGNIKGKSSLEKISKLYDKKQELFNKIGISDFIEIGSKKSNNEDKKSTKKVIKDIVKVEQDINAEVSTRALYAIYKNTTEKTSKNPEILRFKALKKI